MKDKTHIVTGAFGYTGSYIASELLRRNYNVITLSNAVNRKNPFKGQVEQVNFNFDDKDSLVSTLQKGSVLYNTYWVRFKEYNFTRAIENTKKLIEAAKEAEISHIVHISVTNPDKADGLEYFEGKRILEEYIVNSGMPYTIPRPALIYGSGDILINNIAWCLRKFPVFCLFDKGEFKIEPVSAEELACICIDFAEAKRNGIFDTVGPETYTFKEFVETISDGINCKKPLISCPSDLTYLFATTIGVCFAGDIIITPDEIEGLKQNLLYTGSKPLGKEKFSQWIKDNGNSIGLKYSGEMVKRKYEPDLNN